MYVAVGPSSHGDSAGLDSCSGPSAGSDSEEELLGPQTHAQHYKLIGSLATSSNGRHRPLAPPERASPPPGMSPLRRLLFLSSVLLCVVTIIIFLFVLPCDVESCGGQVPAPHTWVTPLLDYETFGSIEVVERSGGSRAARNIVIMAKQNITVGNGLPHKVFCLDGEKGSVLWMHILYREAEQIACSLVDVNLDGVSECFVSGRQHLLKAIDPVSGLVLWDFLPSTNKPGKNVTISPPARIRDVDNDGIADVVTCRSVGRRASLLLVSGKTGKQLGPALPCPPVCARVTGLLVEGDSLSYTCADSQGKQSEQTTSISGLLVGWGIGINEELFRPNRIYSGGAVRQDRSPPGEARVEGHRLIVDNQGHCPDQCRAQIVVKDRNNNTLYNRSMGDVYGTAPVPLSLTGVTGFLLKYWHKRSLCHSNLSQLQEELLNTSKTCWEWTERVTLLSFNVTDVHVVNVSQRGVVQLCYNNNNTLCQPNPINAYLSMRLGDMDGDGSRELLSVTSTHVIQNGGWRLQADVTAVRLETDLHFLYDQHNDI